jgi:hypothetical protein
MVDPEDLVFPENRTDDFVHSAGRGTVLANWLLDNHSGVWGDKPVLSDPPHILSKRSGPTAK